MMRAYSGLALAIALGGVTACSTPEQINGPNWAGASASPLGREYTPEDAIRQRVAGWVLLGCTVGPLQTLMSCRVMHEAPRGWGFGDAALALREGLRLRQDDEGRAIAPETGEFVQVPVYFCPPDRVGCAAGFRVERARLKIGIQMAMSHIRAGDCAAALAATEDLGAPRLVKDVEQQCRSRGLALPATLSPSEPPRSPGAQQP